MSWLTFWTSLLFSLIGSGVLTTIISILLTKNQEKETRIFNLKFKQYEEYIHILLGLFQEDSKGRKINKKDVFELDAATSGIILVAPKKITEIVTELNQDISKVYGARGTEVVRTLKNIVSMRKKLIFLLKEDLNFKS